MQRQHKIKDQSQREPFRTNHHRHNSSKPSSSPHPGRWVIRPRNEKRVPKTTGAASTELGTWEKSRQRSLHRAANPIVHFILNTRSSSWSLSLRGILRRWSNPWCGRELLWTGCAGSHSKRGHHPPPSDTRGKTTMQLIRPQSPSKHLSGA